VSESAENGFRWYVFALRRDMPCDNLLSRQYDCASISLGLSNWNMPLCLQGEQIHVGCKLGLPFAAGPQISVLFAVFVASLLTCRAVLCRAVLCRALSDKDRKWVAAIAAKLGECLQQ
jgi:hypothetical protein